MLNFDDLLGEANSAELEQLVALDARLQFDDAVNNQFTSGTTGLSKGATLTHSPMPTIPPQQTLMPALRTRASVSSRSWYSRVEIMFRRAGLGLAAKRAPSHATSFA